MVQAEFETKLNRSCLHLYKEEHYEEDYQMPMLRQNQLDGLLKVEGCEVEGKARYTYEISGLTSMKNMYENTCIKKQEIEGAIARILEVTETLQRYMLDPNCLVLKPEYIFNKEGQWFFCFFPGMEEDLCKLFHELTEYFVRMLDYEDTEGIFLAYELHKATLQEHYDLELIMKEYKSRESERNKMLKEKKKSVRVKRENKGYGRGRSGGEGGRYNEQISAETEYKRPGETGDEYDKKQSRTEHQYDSLESKGYDYGRNSGVENEYKNYGNIFSVADEYDTDSGCSTYDRDEQIHMADTICEDGVGGWWKSWRKAANGIRRKRWGNWDDLILETDRQEEES